MFKSFQNLYEDCQTQTSDSDTASLSYLKTKLNEGISKAYGILNAEHFYTNATDTTADGQSSYPKPYNCDKMVSVKVTIGSVDYVAIEFPGSGSQWIALTGGTGTASENAYPTYFFVKRNTYEIWPTSSTDGYTITVRYKRRHKDLTQADYTTGTITTLANAGTAVTGSGTTWTAAFIGRFFKIDADGEWYEISARTSNTAITLAREYGGTAISGGSESYTIGEGSLLPFDFQDIPMNFALWKYYKQKKRLDLANDYKQEWLENLEDLKSYASSDTVSGVLSEDIAIKNPNEWPQNLS